MTVTEETARMQASNGRLETIVSNAAFCDNSKQIKQASNRMNRVAIYARISVDAKGQGLGVERQVKDCREYAAARGWSVVLEFVDNDTSAYSGKKRPGYEQLLQAIRDGQIDKVVAFHTDRLHRRLRDLVEYCDVVMKTNVTTHTIKAGDIDLSTPNGIMLAQIKGAVDEAYVSEARLKNIRARRQIAENGGRHMTSRPYGWEDDGIALRDSEAAVVREIVDRLIDGETGTSIANDLNARAIPTVGGKEWTGIGVKKTALRPSNAAIRSHHDAEYDGNWQPIITREKRDELLLAMNSKTSAAYRRGPGRKYLLSGFAVCGICGNKLSVGAGRSNSKSAYRCDGIKSHLPERVGCGKISRHVVPLDDMVTEFILMRLDGRPLLEAVNQAKDATDEMKTLLQEAAAQREKIDQLVDEYATTNLWTKAQFARAKSAADARLEELERKINGLSHNKTLASIDLSKGLRETWEKATLQWKRRLIDMMIEKIVVMPYQKSGYKLVKYNGFRFDPSLIEVTWRV